MIYPTLEKDYTVLKVHTRSERQPCIPKCEVSLPQWVSSVSAGEIWPYLCIDLAGAVLKKGEK